MVCINDLWNRGRILKAELSESGHIECMCIDYGNSYQVHISDVRTLDLSGHEALYVKECPPMSKKIFLFDVAATKGLKSPYYWSDASLRFLKEHMENVIWNAMPLQMLGEYQGLRLFDPNFKLLAAMLIERSLAVPTQTYHEAVNMCEVMGKQFDFMIPFNNLSAGGNLPNTIAPVNILSNNGEHHYLVCIITEVTYSFISI